MSDYNHLHTALTNIGIEFSSAETISLTESSRGRTLTIGQVMLSFDESGTYKDTTNLALEQEARVASRALALVTQLQAAARTAPAMKYLANLRENEPNHPTIQYIDEMLNSERD